MNTWLADFHARTELNRYPTVAYRGGIGYRKPTGETVSNFVGHPVHYFDGIWKPITLQRHANGDLEGSDFGWNGGHVTYKKRPLFQPKAVIFDGKRYNLDLKWNGSSLTCDLPFGVYEVRFTEKGVKEWLTIPDPVEGLIEFDVHHANKPDGLYKKDRHIVGGAFGESFQLTKNMKYPLEIDPDYSADAADAMVQGYSTSYATARSTAYSQSSVGSRIQVGQRLSGSDFEVYRGFEVYDTSGIPDTDSVTQVNMSMYLETKYGTASYDVLIKKYDWSGSSPIGAGNMETVFDGALAASADDNIWQASGSVSDGNRYDSGNLNTSWVSKTGLTYYAIISSRDASATEPTTNEFMEISAQEHATSGNRPYLTVVHVEASCFIPWFSAP